MHSCNKNEAIVKNHPYFNEVKGRKNVLLLGDKIDDLDMSKGIEHDEIIKIGFLNLKEENKEELLIYSQYFDAVILNDGSLEYVVELVGKILER